MWERIRALREDRDLSQKDIAQELNVAQTTYSDYEHAKINIPVHTLIRLALFYDVSIDYLVGITDDPRPYKRSK